MELRVEHQWRGVGTVTGIQDSHLWDVVPLEEIDPKTLLACERPRLGCGPLFRYDKDDLADLHLRVEVPGKPRFYVPIKAVLKREGGIVGSNFAEKKLRQPARLLDWSKSWDYFSLRPGSPVNLRSARSLVRTRLQCLRDLGNLPRFTFDHALSYEQPPAGELDEETISFLDNVAHILVLDLNLDGDLIREMQEDDHFLVYFSFYQLALDTSWLTVDFLTLEHRLLPWRKSLKGHALVLEYREGTVNAAAWLENGRDDNTPGIHYQMSHEQFVAQNPDINCHSREARNWYFEMDESERKQWLAYDEDSVFNQPFPNTAVSQLDLDAKSCRDLRHELLTSLFHEAYEWCRAGRAPKYSLIIKPENLFEQQTLVAKPQANVYGRFGKMIQTAESRFHGPGLVFVNRGGYTEQPPATIINTLFRRIFGVRKGWQEKIEGYLASAEQQKQSAKPDVRHQAAHSKALANRMGVFLTQTQLHEIRLLTEWLYNRFDVPMQLRRPTQEQHPVSESRVNDLAEVMRKVQAQIEVLEHELVVGTSYQQLAGARDMLRRLLHRARSLNQQQVNLAAELTNSPEFAKRLEGLKMEGESLEVVQLEAMADALEDDIRRLLDPGHQHFNCNLPMAQLIYGKARLHRRLHDLKERLHDVDQPERIRRLADMLQKLQLEYELYETRAECFLEDLPVRQRRQLGIEVPKYNG